MPSRKHLQWNIFWVCVYSLIYPACKVRTPYYIAICYLSGPMRYFHIISWQTRFSGKSYKTWSVCVFIVSTNLSETFPFLRRIERDMIKKYTHVLMQSTRYSCQIWMKLGFQDRFSKNTEIWLFYENPYGESTVVPSERTDRHIWRSNFAKVPKNRDKMKVCIIRGVTDKWGLQLYEIRFW